MTRRACVYIVAEAGDSTWVKVGWSAFACRHPDATSCRCRPRVRLRELQAGNPRTLYVRAVFVVGLGVGAALERDLHLALGPTRGRGEWFRGGVAVDALVGAMLDDDPEAAVKAWARHALGSKAVLGPRPAVFYREWRVGA